MVTNRMKLLPIWLGLSLPLVFSFNARAYEEITVKEGGAIRGFVGVEGETPPLPSLEVSKYKEVCKDVPDESLVVGPGRGLRYAVVTLEGVAAGKAVEREAVNELDNLGCRFSPHVQAASVGQWLVIKNSDPILHTAHAFFGAGGQPQFNVGLFPGKVSRKPLVSPGVVKVLCEVHPWMRAYIVVTEHPYHAVTDAYGEYGISDVPPGTYRLKVWHETLGTMEKQVEVKSGSVTEVKFVLSAAQGAKR